MSELLTDDEILTALNDDGDNMLSEFKLRDARIIESLVRQKTHIVWIPNDGVMPACKIALIRFNSGVISKGTNPSLYNFSVTNKSYGVKEYAIIEE